MLEWVPRKAEEAPFLETAQTHPDKTWSSLIYLALFCAGSCRRWPLRFPPVWATLWCPSWHCCFFFIYFSLYLNSLLCSHFLSERSYRCRRYRCGSLWSYHPEQHVAASLPLPFHEWSGRRICAVGTARPVGAYQDSRYLGKSSMVKDSSRKASPIALCTVMRGVRSDSPMDLQTLQTACTASKQSGFFCNGRVPSSGRDLNRPVALAVNQ